MPTRADTRMHVFTARMPVEEYEALRAYASLAQSSVNDVMQRAVRAYLRAHSGDEEIEVMVARTRRRLRATVERLPEE